MEHARETDVYDCVHERVIDTLGCTVTAQLLVDGPQRVKLCFMIKILEK